MKFFVLKILMLFDFFHKRKILRALKNLLKKNDNIIFDVGGHHGESIFFFNTNFNTSKIYTFEPIEDNFLKLKNKTKNIQEKVIYFNFALGNKKEKKAIKKMIETSSSTLNEINEKSKYFKKKKFFLGLSKKDKMYIEKNVFIEKGIDIIKKFKIDKVDLLKIDTEGYELNVIRGFEKSIDKVDSVIFEHHYDTMIKKTYTYSDVNKYLINSGFQLKYKFKMPFRRTFEYIYSK
ncbi:MAG: hypothetical protein CMJ06_02215 [Pelagibacterales bacterium]|nr:hypothetical protein [Pelagibacterales bacterium]OUU63230.1 MAG: hypothetical protein CBC22_02180 [Alphaproteobacteria bacterium TMED62]